MSESTNSPPPSLTYGVAIVLDKEVTLRIFDILQKHGVQGIDTARIYTGSEKLLGEVGAPNKFRITTKFVGWAPGTGKRDAVLQSVKESLEELKTEKVEVDIWLLHTIDKATPISETMDAIQEVYEQGRFNKFGVSNFTAKEFQEIYDYAKSKSYVLPTVYQVNYNLVARRAESDLFPLLRSLNVSIQVYAPIASGFLVKTSEYINNPPDGSGWDPKIIYGSILQKLYNKPSLLDFLKQFGELSQESGVSKLGLAYRWMRYHSALRGELGDTIIFGASKEQQVQETLIEIEKGSLEDWVVKRLDEMWKPIEKDAPYNVNDAFP